MYYFYRMSQSESPTLPYYLRSGEGRNPDKEAFDRLQEGQIVEIIAGNKKQIGTKGIITKKKENFKIEIQDSKNTYLYLTALAKDVRPPEGTIYFRKQLFCAYKDNNFLSFTVCRELRQLHIPRVDRKVNKPRYPKTSMQDFACDLDPSAKEYEDRPVNGYGEAYLQGFL